MVIKSGDESDIDKGMVGVCVEHRRAKERAPYIPLRSIAPSTLGEHIEPSRSHGDIPDIRIAL
jgi:hypothetical protein